MKNKISRAVSGGFTLVELLIVIALIAILSVAVLATINPIEQSNKARDAKFKNDSAEVLGALERYYASKNEYPWNSASFTGVNPFPSLIVANTVLTLEGKDPRFGIMDVTGAPAGLMIESSELKTSFGGKEPFVATAAVTDQMYVYHNGTDSSYVCFCPKAKANRTAPVSSTLKCITGNPTTAATFVLQNAGVATCTVPTAAEIAAPGYCNPGNANAGVFIANMICVPEGAIN